MTNPPFRAISQHFKKREAGLKWPDRAVAALGQMGMVFFLNRCGWYTLHTQNSLIRLSEKSKHQAVKCSFYLKTCGILNVKVVYLSTCARPRTGVIYKHVWTYVWVFSCRPGRSMRPHRCCLALYTWSEWRGRRRWRRVGGERDGRCALNGCDANGTRGHRNQFTLLKQMRAAQPCHGVGSFFLFFFLAAPIVIVINPPNPNSWPSLSQAQPSPSAAPSMAAWGPFYPNEKALEVLR